MSVGILLSGGVDSSALAFWKKPLVCLTVDYGQLSAAAEIKSAALVARELGLCHEIIRVDCTPVGSGDLAGKPALKRSHTPEWWPFRNQLLVTLCAMRAVEIGVHELILGSVNSDSIHRDGTAEFFSLLDRTVACQEGGLHVSAPALKMTSLELIIASTISNEILINTHSCHTGSLPCGRCRGCQRRFMIFQKLGLEGGCETAVNDAQTLARFPDRPA